MSGRRSAYYASAFGCGGTGSRSRRAQIAEAEGKEPATRAAKTWGFKSAEALRRWVPSGEWHHVSKFANPVSYYDVRGWIEECDISSLANLNGISRDLTAKGLSMVLAPMVAKFFAANMDSSPCITTLRRLAGYYQKKPCLASRSHST